MSIYGKGAKGACDRLFSLIIRAKGYCEVCGRTENLQCMHIVSRRYSNTRCDPENALSGCAKCHMFFTAHPIEFARWIENHLGADHYDRVWARAQQTTKVKWEEVLVELKIRAKELEL